VLLGEALALGFLMAYDRRGCLVRRAFAVSVWLVEHHDVAMLARADVHASVVAAHVLVQRISASIVTSGCLCSRMTFIKMLKIVHVGASFARFGSRLVLPLKRIAGRRC